jgi:hypothetical protein
MRFADSIELLDYFDWLPEDTRNALLKTLCTANEFKSSNPTKEES